MKIPIVGPKIKVDEIIWCDLSKLSSICCDLSKLVREGQKVNEKVFKTIGLSGFEKKPKN